MENTVNFDVLAQKFFAARGEDTYCDLFGAAFALEQWHFIADGEPPNLSPYCAIFPDFFDAQPMVLAFTDKEKLNAYVAEKNLHTSSADKPITLHSPDATVKFSSENLILSIPTTSIVDYLERLTAKGVKGVFFNPNKMSEGFHLGLPQLRETKELVDSKKPKSEAAKTVEPAMPTDFDALARKSNESGGAMSDLNNLFGSTFALETWVFIARGELPNISPYVAANADYADGQPMIRSFTDSERLQRFAEENNLTAADGSTQMLEIPVKGAVEYLEQFIQYGVHGVWFNSDTNSDGYFIPLKQLRPIKEHLAKIGWKSIAEPTDSSLPHNSGFVPPVNSQPAREPKAVTETNQLTSERSASFANYLNWFRRGTIKFDTSFKTFFKAIAPLLENYAGAGAFTFTFATGMDEPNMKDLFEDVTSNAHGAFLKYRSYVIQRRAEEPIYDMQVLGSNQLTNVQTGEKLLVQLTIHKKPENQETTLIVRFLGSAAEVEKLGIAVQPALEDCGFQVKLDSKHPPSPDALKELGG